MNFPRDKTGPKKKSVWGVGRREPDIECRVGLNSRKERKMAATIGDSMEHALVSKCCMKMLDQRVRVF